MTHPMIVQLPWTAPPVSPNGSRSHPHVHAAKVRVALEQARMAVRAAHLGPVLGAEVDLHYRVPDRRRRDADNLHGVLKIAQDALVLEGVLPRDDWQHVPRSGCVIHPPNGQAASLWVELTKVVHLQTEETA